MSAKIVVTLAKTSKNCRKVCSKGIRLDMTHTNQVLILSRQRRLNFNISEESFCIYASYCS